MSHPFALLLIHFSLSWGYLFYISRCLWTRKGRGRGTCGCGWICALCFWYCALLSATILLSLYFHHVFSWCGEDKALIISNYTLPPPFTVNNSTTSLCVPLFLVHVHVTIYVLLYVFLFSYPSPKRWLGILDYIPCIIFTSPSDILPPPVPTSIASSFTTAPLSTFFFPSLVSQPMISWGFL